jgi:hypothetical protein
VYSWAYLELISGVDTHQAMTCLCSGGDGSRIRSRTILGTDQNHRIVENGERHIRQHDTLITRSLNGDCLKGNA